MLFSDTMTWSHGITAVQVTVSFVSGKKEIMKKYLFTLLFILSTPLFSQDTTGVIAQRIIQINNAVETAFLEKNAAALDTLFGNDLLFFHGGGNVDNKASYIARVPRGNYTSRTADSIKVEVHGNSALVYGRVIVHNGGEKPKPPYGIRYIRLFALRNDRWELVSHRTLQKWDESH